MRSSSRTSVVLQQLSGYLSASYLPPLLAFVGALLVMLLVGGPMVRFLKSLKGTKWSPREDTPDSHAVKAGTPSMGGIGIIGVALFVYIGLMSFCWVTGAGGLFTRSAMALPVALSVPVLASLAWLPCVALLHALLGFADDWSKATGRGGLRARSKLFFQVLLACGFALALFYLAWKQTFATVRYVYPQLVEMRRDLLGYGLLGFAFVVLVVVASGNAVNLTDGLDGLAAGLCVQVGFALWLAGGGPAPFDINGFVIIFWAALAGACLGFLRFNRFRASVFMGDTGSLALGACLGAAAIASQTVFLLPFIGFIFWIETLSVMLQVGYFKYTKRHGDGKRLFKRAPLHHHFELAGWSEWRVVLTFWAVNFFVAAMGLALWSAGILPRWP